MIFKGIFNVYKSAEILIDIINVNKYNIFKKGVSIMLTINQITEAAEIVAKEFPIIRMQLFGSYAENRDVDILIEFSHDATITLLTVCMIKERMEELLNTVVDVITLPIPKDSMLEINKVVQLYAA